VLAVPGQPDSIAYLHGFQPQVTYGHEGVVVVEHVRLVAHPPCGRDDHDGVDREDGDRSRSGCE
jgi:hypothetical protein